MGHFETDVVFDVMEGYVRKIVAFETENKGLRDQVSELRDCNYQLHQDLNGNTVMMDSIRKDRAKFEEAATNRIKELEATIEQDQEILAGNVKAMQEAAKEIKALQASVEAHKITITCLERDIEGLRTRNMNQRNRIEAMQNTIDKLQEASQHEDSQAGN